MRPFQTLRVCSLATALLSAAMGYAFAQGGDIPPNADQELARIYRDVVQKEMPGVPFSVLDGAKKEGSLLWFHIRLPAAQPAIIAAFEKRFPFVKVETFEGTGPALYQRFVSEKRANVNKVDILQSTSPVFIEEAHKAGYLANYTITSEKYFTEGSYKRGVWYPYANATQVIYAYNKNLVTPEQAKLLENYEGLWDPALDKLKIATGSAVDNAQTQLFFYFIEQKYGRTSWEKLAEKKPMLIGGTPGIDAVSRGEVAIAMVSEGNGLTAYNNKAPVAWTVPSPALSQLYPQAIADKAPHPNAARLFHEFVMSKPAQEIYAANAYPVARTDVPELRSELTKETWFKTKREYFIIDYEKFNATLSKLISDWKTTFRIR